MLLFESTALPPAPPDGAEDLLPHDVALSEWGGDADPPTLRDATRDNPALCVREAHGEAEALGDNEAEPLSDTSVEEVMLNDDDEDAQTLNEEDVHAEAITLKESNGDGEAQADGDSLND